ncbi:MAG: hypothetical protein AUG89_09225 [Acidobacteria bacterium 13_1_20CM_4_56_7]|nr:MAG: hypothetical protein AUG89_09225 [Acidobacteria bacterium 13_1_20CM_4_56_7]
MMKRGTNNFFGQVLRPIVAAHMQEFVTSNRGSESRVHGREVLGQQNYRHGKAESHWRIHVGGKAELGASVHLGSHFFENGGGFSKRANWRGCLPELAKFQQRSIFNTPSKSFKS